MAVIYDVKAKLTAGESDKFFKVYTATLTLSAASNGTVYLPIRGKITGNVWMNVIKTAGNTNVDEIDFFLCPGIIDDNDDLVANQAGFTDVKVGGTKIDFTDATSTPYFSMDITGWYDDNGTYEQYLGRPGLLVRIDDNVLVKPRYHR